MAAVDILPAFPELPQHVYTVLMAGALYTVRMTYRARTRGWYMDIADNDGVVLFAGRRLSPGWSPTAGVVMPTDFGALAVQGFDEYLRTDLGTALRVMRFTPDPTPAPSDVSVELL